MLASDEFAVGPFAGVAPLSLILPRTKFEVVALIGTMKGAPAAVFLSGQYAFQCFQSADNRNWQGLIVPKVRIEVDETSLFDPDYGSPMGTVVRQETDLVVRARTENSFGQTAPVTLHGGLPACELKAGFSQWQVVIGEGLDKRVLWRTPPVETAE